MVGYFPLKVLLFKKKPIFSAFTFAKNLMLVANLQINARFRQFLNNIKIFCKNTNETFII
jgi:hypothetical protein